LFFLVYDRHWCEGTQDFCSLDFGLRQFSLLGLVLLTSAAALVKKLLEIRDFPRMWAKYNELREEEAELAQRFVPCA
jgi:hypothetical protein